MLLRQVAAVAVVGDAAEVVPLTRALRSPMRQLGAVEEVVPEVEVGVVAALLPPLAVAVGAVPLPASAPLRSRRSS